MVVKSKGFIKIAVFLIALVVYPNVNAVSTDTVNVLRQGLVTNYPNPFDSRLESTTIVYSFSGEGQVSMKIFDVFGNLVRSYLMVRHIPGLNMIEWDGTNENGQKVAKGGYICIVEISNNAGTVLASRKIGVIH